MLNCVMLKENRFNMDVLDVIQNKKILEALTNASKILDDKYGNFEINRLIDYYSNKISEFNNSNFCAIDKTKTEIGTFNSNVKKILSARIPDLDLKNVVFSNELIDAYILFNRRFSWYKRSVIGVQLKETLSIMMIDEYYKCKNK